MIFSHLFNFHIWIVVLISVTIRANPQEVPQALESISRLQGLPLQYLDSPTEESEQVRPCIPRDFGKGSVVCVCNSTYCDTVGITIPKEIANPLIPPSSLHSSSIPSISTFGSATTLKTISGTGSPSAQTFDEKKRKRGARVATTGGEPDYRGQVQIFTSTKTGSRLHKSIVHFNNEEPYDKDDLLSRHDDLIVRATKLESALTSSRSQRLDTRTNEIPLTYPNDLNLFSLFGDYPRPDKLTKFTVRRDIQYQKVLGYGGAFTDAAGINIGMLSQPTQENLMKSYFGQEGIDYSMGRVPIGGTDFSTRPYTYDDDVQDLGGVDANLTKFALQPEDFKLKIPYIHWAQQLSGNKVKLVASPWSAPGWMKTSGRIHGMGQLKKQFYQQWADYFVKFLQDYKNQDVNVWGITTGNEPFNGFVPMWPFNNMGWKASDMRRFIANNLGPTLAAAKLDPRVIMLDDNKGSVHSWAKEVRQMFIRKTLPGRVILSQNDSAQYVHGVGTHWYLDFLTSPDVLSRFHNNYPDYFIVQTEACLGFTPWEREKVSLGNWERGEQYLEAIIQDSRNYVGGWIDWNLALDLQGGPNWAKLRADAAILVNATADEFLKQPIYYGIGHVSKFVPPDSVRIDMTADSFAPRGLQTVAFLRPDNGIAIVILNKLRYDAKIAIRDPARGVIDVNIPQQSFLTMLYW